MDLAEALGANRIEVDLPGKPLADGKSPRVLLRQLSMLEWTAVQGIPVEAAAKPAGRGGSDSTALAIKNWNIMREVVRRAVVGVEVPEQTAANGEWLRVWRPVRVVDGAVPQGEGTIALEQLDDRKRKTIATLYAALIADLTDGGAFEAVKGDRFPDGEGGALVGSGDEDGANAT